MTWRAWADQALAALVAPPCAACGLPVPRPLNGAVCDACWSAIRTFAPPCCRVCGVPLPSWRVAAVQSGCCPRCRRAPGFVHALASIGPHDGVLRDLVHALKYERRVSIVAPLAARMRAAGAGVLDGAHLAVPVPLHPWRAFARGFNQAALLAAHLGPPVHPLLRRRRATPPQVALPAARRHQNVRGAFAWRSGRARRALRLSGVPLERLVVVLVDDVCTTGATLEACARVLRASGVGEVRAITASRVVSGPRP